MYYYENAIGPNDEFKAWRKQKNNEFNKFLLLNVRAKQFNITIFHKNDRFYNFFYITFTYSNNYN